MHSVPYRSSALARHPALRREKFDRLNVTLFSQAFTVL